MAPSQSPSVGDLIKQARKTAGLSQKELGDYVHVSQQAVQRWEAGKAHPDRYHIVAIARTLPELDPAELLLALTDLPDIDVDEVRSRLGIADPNEPDYNTKLARVGPATRRVIDDIIDAELSRRSR